MIHNRCSHIIRKPLCAFLKERHKVIEEVRNYVSFMKDKNENFSGETYDVNAAMSKVTDSIRGKMEK